jgi:hypothetical protein
MTCVMMVFWELDGTVEPLADYELSKANWELRLPF